MAKYTGADCRLCRREGCKLFLKGEKCYSNKCTLLKRPQAPGQHGTGRRKPSGYAIQLREKQKTKRMYGLQEKQFRMYYNMAEKMRGVTGENMLILIESRLDNVVYNLGFGSSRAMARQLVNHGHITVNGISVNIPSYLVKAGDVIAVKSTKLDKAVFADFKAGNVKVSVPAWLSLDTAALSGKVEKIPERADITDTIQEHLIVELYSK